MPEEVPALEAIHEAIWTMLQAAVENRDHPMHTPAIANSGATGPEVRMVVLRAVDPQERLLLFHTDARSPKIADLEVNPQVQWLFYDPEARTQLRIAARATVHRADALADQDWAEAPPLSRRCYLSEFAPGTPLDAPASGIPEELQERRPTEEETAPGRKNFAVVQCEMRQVNWLLLRATGNLSATFSYGEAGDLTARWTAP